MVLHDFSLSSGSGGLRSMRSASFPFNEFFNSKKIEAVIPKRIIIKMKKMRIS
jgi:hypothetical protein